MSSNDPFDSVHERGRTVRSRVWDLPTRMFHWLLAAPVIALVVSGKIGGNALEWHTIVYYAVVKKQRLVPAMIHGDKPLAASLEASRDDAVSRAVALVVTALAIALSGWVWSLGR